MVQDYCAECSYREMPTNQMAPTHQMICGGYPCDMLMSTMEMKMPYDMQMMSPISATPMPMGIGNMGPQMQNMSQMQSFPQMPNIQALPSFPMETDSNLNNIPTSQVASNINYTQGYLRTKIGSQVRVEFLIGTNTFSDRRGTLINVGISFIILKEVDTNTELLCDIYSIRFVRFIR